LAYRGAVYRAQCFDVDVKIFGFRICCQDYRFYGALREWYVPNIGKDVPQNSAPTGVGDALTVSQDIIGNNICKHTSTTKPHKKIRLQMYTHPLGMLFAGMMARELM
jgi:hypothetical protein